MQRDPAPNRYPVGREISFARGLRGATVIAAYSPRLRPGVPVSFPVSWDELGRVSPADFTIRNALELLGDTNPWAAQMVAPQHLGVDLIAEGHEIPGGRVQAMHEGKRRARARRT